jgi:hypothetical protein
MSGVIAGLAISTVSAGASFAQAAKQNRLKRQAQENAEQAMADAKKQLDKNFAEQQAIKKEAYDLERQAMLVQGAQLTQAGIESERGSAATAGRVFAQQQLGQQQIRSAMADEMTNIEAAVLEEESRLRDLGVGLDLEEVAGQQMMAADAQRAAAASTQQGFQSALGAAQLAVEQVPLYRETRAEKLARKAAEAEAFRADALATMPTAESYKKMGLNAQTPQTGSDFLMPTTINPFALSLDPTLSNKKPFEFYTDVSLFPMPGYTYDPITGKYKK